MKRDISIIITFMMAALWFSSCDADINLVDTRTGKKIAAKKDNNQDAKSNKPTPKAEDQIEEVVELPPTPEEILKAMADEGTVKFESAGRATNDAPINTAANPIVALFYDGQPDKNFSVDLCVDANSANLTIHSGGNGPFGHMPVNPDSGQAGFPGECNPLVITRYPASLDSDGFYNHDAGNGAQQPLFFTVIKVDANGAEIERITNVPAT